MNTYKTLLILLFASSATVLLLSSGCASTDQQTYAQSAAQAETAAQRLAAPEEAKAKKAEAAGDKREALQHYVAALQSLPADDVSEKGVEIRRSIISLALTMTPPPAIPEEAQRHFDQAALILKDSKNELACARAAQEFEASLRLAPWNSNAYYNLGGLKELANDKDSAIRNFKLYLLAAPGAPDARGVQNKIAALELAKPKTGLAALEGIWRTVEIDGEVARDNYKSHWVFQVQGKEIVVTHVYDVDIPSFDALKGDTRVSMKFSLDGRRIRGRVMNGNLIEGIVNEDFNEIYFTEHYSVSGNSITYRVRRFDN
jgi:tetratricopeptide (TPR) repeat protein